MGIKVDRQHRILSYGYKQRTVSRPEARLGLRLILTDALGVLCSGDGVSIVEALLERVTLRDGQSGLAW